MSLQEFGAKLLIYNKQWALAYVECVSNRSGESTLDSIKLTRLELKWQKLRKNLSSKKNLNVSSLLFSSIKHICTSTCISLSAQQSKLSGFVSFSLE